MPDADFDAVEAGALLPVPCSPALEDEADFLGIRITAPERVRLAPGARRARIMLCGGYQLPAGYVGLGGSLQNGVWLVATDLEHDRVLVGPAVSERGEPSMADDDGGAERGTGLEVLMLEYFNTDLGEALRLPAEPATWYVYALIGDAVSNVVAIELTERS